MRRYKMNQRKSERLFTNTASKTHWRNHTKLPMRGGTRL